MPQSTGRVHFIFGALITVALSLSGCGTKEVILWAGGWCSHFGSGQLQLVSRDFSNYTALRVTDDIQAEVIVGGTASFSIEVKENLVQELRMYVDQGVLNLGFKTSGVCNSGAKARIVVTEALKGATSAGSAELKADLLHGFVRAEDSGDVVVQRLVGTSTALGLSGSGSLTVEELDAQESANMNAGGAGTLHVHSLRVATATVKVHGSGTFKVDAGSISDALDLSSDGSAEVLLHDLQAHNASIVVTGSGSVSGMTSTNLRFDISGSGSLQTTADNLISASCSGAGSASIGGTASPAVPDSCFSRRLVAM